ncbi:NUDIX hydrolase [Streptomyces sp. SS8]
MTITAEHVRATLGAYLDQYPEDKTRLAGLVDLLGRAGDAIASRNTLPGHVTAGAVLLNADGRVLFIEHRALSKWLLPGGHVEPGDVTLAAAALRELEEETGINPAAVELVGEVPVHVDAHVIPESTLKGEPEHWHYDFRFLLSTRAEVSGLQEEEVTGYTWLPAEDIPSAELRYRVAATLS